MCRTLAVLGLLCSGTTKAGGTLSGTIEQLRFANMTAGPARWQLHQDQGQNSLRLVLAQASLAGDQLLTDLVLDCPAVGWNEQQINCGAADWRLVLNGRQLKGNGDLSYRFTSSSWQVDTAINSDDGWSIHLDVKGDEEGVSAVLAPGSEVDLSFLAATLDLPVTVHSGKSTLSGEIRYADQFQISLAGEVSSLAFDSREGTHAGDSLGAQWQLNVAEDDEELSFQLSIARLLGELLADDLYLNLGDVPQLQARAEGRRLQDQSWRIDSLQLSDRDSLSLEAGLAFDAAGKFQSMTARSLKLGFPAAHQRYLASVLEARGQGARIAGGRLQAAFAIRNDQFTELDLSLEELAVTDPDDRFSVTGLDGRVVLDAGPSNVSWEGASVYAVPIGASAVEFGWSGERIELLRPARIGVLNGAVNIARFSLGASYDGVPGELEFEGDIQPLSLTELTRALGWPEFSGALSGRIPRVHLQDGVVLVDGDIQMDVFDGQVVLGGLRLERLFSVLPTLAADISLQDIDLQQMTSAFSFGRIEGRLDGQVTGLRLLDWQPVAFDLSLATDSEQPGKRRISQRAVENLSSIGGGATAAISQTFLKVFDDFGYRQLGLNCRLANNRCVMSGVGPAENGGYFIVQGRGLPRIDVVGYSRQVDWPQLLRRLQAATRAAPSID